MEPTARPTKEVVHLIDIDDEMPGRGQEVLALSLGGVLCQVVWAKDSHEFFKAWMPKPKIPAKVKQKLSDLYASGKSWGTHGTQVHSNGHTN